VLLAEARAELQRQQAEAEAGAAVGAAQPVGKPDRKPALRPLPAQAGKPVAGRRRPGWARRRHRLVLASFVALVLLPAAVAAWYLYARAVDQYASVMAFTVRSEDNRSALDVLGRLGSSFAFGGGGASTDGEILYQFIQSQELVARIDARLDLRSLYGRYHATDPFFAFLPGGTVEDLTEHWARKLRIAFDTGTGLMEIRVLAFDPDEAQAIARAILEESTRRINELSAIAREDATRHAREDLDLALARLRAAREAVTEFRIRTQIVDPTADIQGQMGLLNTLQAQLAEALIELDLLRENTREGDPRITQAERRIEVIRARINEERARIGGGAGPGGEDYATVVAEFERLNLDREFAEQSYRSALSAYDAALAQAQRNTRYLATHIEPTLAESARYPEREMLLGLTVFFLMLGWSLGVLIYYSVRDSR
jgi:capsular polysaccharide transport system permease protein